LTVKDGKSIYEEWLELDNGCLCCAVKDNGVQAIENLMAKKGKFDYILLETTGVADPAPIANMFWLDEALAASIYLDGIITVMDASHILKNLDDHSDGISTANIQVAEADVLLLNKCDKVSQQELANIQNRLQGINSMARILQTTYGNVPLSDILDLKAYDGKVVAEMLDKYRTKGWHNHEITTIAFGFGGTSAEQNAKIESWLQNILWEATMDGISVEIHRVKGRLVENGSVRIIQGVRETYEIVDTDDIYEGDCPGKIVLIGKGLSDEVVKQSFESTGVQISNAI
jgi:G3E family GTPase